MPEEGPVRNRAGGQGPAFALLQLQFRMFCNNRSACVVLLCLSMAGWLYPAGESLYEPSCYVVYWQDHPWMDHLRSKLPTEGDLRIELAPVEQFTNEDGLIVYPPGTHSIQLRPPSESSRWTIWYWYSGHRPEALEPAIAWFWEASESYWKEQLPVEVRTSSLTPIGPLTKMTNGITNLAKSGDQSRAMLLLMCVFFCTAYLQTSHLGEHVHSRVLDTVLTKPVSRPRWAVTLIAFHLLLTLAAALPILLVAGWLGRLDVWVCLLLMASAYTGLAYLLACNCSSVLTSGSALLIYCLVSALIFVAASVWSGSPVGFLSLEYGFVGGLAESEGAVLRGCSSLLGGAILFGLAGWASFVRWSCR